MRGGVTPRALVLFKLQPAVRVYGFARFGRRTARTFPLAPPPQ
jgi:hypothetical protein